MVINIKIQDFKNSYFDLYGTTKGFFSSEFYNFYKYAKKKVAEYKKIPKKERPVFAKSKQKDALRKMAKVYETKTSNEFLSKQKKTIELKSLTTQPFFAVETMKRTPNSPTGQKTKKLQDLNTKNKETVYSIRINFDKSSEIAGKDTVFTTKVFADFQNELQKTNFRMNNLKYKVGGAAVAPDKVYENVSVDISLSESDDNFFIDYDYNID